MAPGYVKTEMTADVSEGREATLRAGECLAGGVSAQQVASVVRFLLSADASGITGQLIRVDAGASA